MALSKPQFRFFEEILQDMVNYVRLQSPELTDWNVGSRIRSILEAVAMEDDEQYHQMAALLRIWNLANNTGVDLDERLAEYNLVRRDALPASGTVIFSNGGLITSFVSSAVAKGSTSLVAYSTQGFPSTGTLRIGEGLSTVEDVAFTGNATATGTFTLSALANDHSKNERVSLVSGGTINIPSGTQVAVPATDVTPQRVATTQTGGTIAAGNYESAPVTILMDTPGEEGNVSKGAITLFSGNPPFDGAGVRNDSAVQGGRPQESDEQFLARGRNHLSSLARCTRLALKQLVLGVSFTTATGITQQVVSASVREDFQPNSSQDRVLLYVWPGSFGFETTGTSGVEVLTAGAEDGQKFFQLNYNAVVPGSLVLERQIVGSGSFVAMVEGVDYFVNEGTGQVQMAVNSNTGLNKGDQVRASSYKYYTGLIKEVQNTINGLDYDPVVYPGISAVGVKVLALSPRLQTISQIKCNIQVTQGFTEASVSLLVKDAITQYLNELNIGDNVILSELIERAMGVSGMYNVQFTSPTQDIIVFDDAVLDLSSLDIVVS